MSANVIPLQPSLSEWEDSLRSTVPEGLMVRSFLRPQRSFRYPAFPELLLEDRSEAHFAAELARVVLGEEARSARLRVFTDLESAVGDWLATCVPAGQTVALPRPSPPEFLRAARRRGHSVRFLPRDPDELADTNLAGCGAFLLSQPNRLDGFYYPEEIYGRLLRRMLDECPAAAVLSDQSTSLFTANTVPPGLARHAAHPRVQVAGSIFPAYCPQGPDVAWWAGVRDPAEPAVTVARGLPAADLAVALAATMAFSVRQGAAFSEFQRKILLLHRSLRGFGEILRPLTKAGLLTITVWPESGFYLALNAQGWIERRQCGSATGLCRALARELGVLLIPGDFTGLPGHIHLAYASPPKPLEELAQILVEAARKEP